MRRFTIILLTLCSLPLFAQQWHTSLDIWIPAEKTLPANGNVLIVNDINCTLTSSVSNLPNGIRPALFVAVQGLEQTEIFTQVDLLDQPVAITNALFDAYHVNALMVCNQLLISDQQESFLTIDDNYYAYLNLHACTRWTLYKQGQTPVHYFYQDSLYWENTSPTPIRALEDLPNREEAIQDMMIYITERFFNQFSGHWETVDRYLYSTEDEIFTQAMDIFRHQRWQAAREAFQAIYESKESSLQAKAYAAANIAVVLEIQENIPAAITWAGIASKAFGKLKSPDGYQQQVNLAFYQQQLEQREH